MAKSDALDRFVYEALSSGRSRAEIETALGDAGWSQNEVAEGLASFAETDFTPPVPRPRPQLTARDAFIYAILFTALGFLAVHLINLVHGILDLRMPDAADGSHVISRATRRIQWAIAVLAISVPVYAWMTIFTERRAARDPAERRSLVRKWLTYLALFAAALSFFGDGVYVIYEFLTGEITMRFILKAVTVAVVSASVFLFYLRNAEDMKDER